MAIRPIYYLIRFKRTDLPLLSIVETAVAAAQQLHLQRLALLGTKLTMQNDFFIKPFREAGIEVCRPSENDQSIIHRSIHNSSKNCRRTRKRDLRKRLSSS